MQKKLLAISWQIPFRFCHFSRPFYLYKIRLIWPGDNCLWTEFMQNWLRSYKSRFQWSLSPKKGWCAGDLHFALWKKWIKRKLFLYKDVVWELVCALREEGENLIGTNSPLLMSCSLKYFFRDKWRHMFQGGWKQFRSEYDKNRIRI